jgi:hypothetical protein
VLWLIHISDHFFLCVGIWSSIPSHCLKLSVFMYLVLVWFVALLGLGHEFLLTGMVTSVRHLVGVQHAGSGNLTCIRYGGNQVAVRGARED